MAALRSRVISGVVSQRSAPLTLPRARYQRFIASTPRRVVWAPAASLAGSVVARRALLERGARPGGAPYRTQRSDEAVAPSRIVTITSPSPSPSTSEPTPHAESAARDRSPRGTWSCHTRPGARSPATRTRQNHQPASSGAPVTRARSARVITAGRHARSIARSRHSSTTTAAGREGAVHWSVGDALPTVLPEGGHTGRSAGSASTGGASGSSVPTTSAGVIASVGVASSRPASPGGGAATVLAHPIKTANESEARSARTMSGSASQASVSRPDAPPLCHTTRPFRQWAPRDIGGALHARREV